MSRSKSKPNVLVLCHDVIGKNMAGPGIRYSNVARVLAKDSNVTLAVLSEQNRSDNKVAVASPDGGYKAFFDKADIIFAQWLSADMVEYAARNGKIIIFDMYAPVPIEYLANLEFSSRGLTKHQMEEFEAIVAMYKNYLGVGSYFVCSNMRQKDFWSGFLTASGLINPKTFSRGLLREQFMICPMGIDAKPPKPAKLSLRNRLDLDKDDFVLLWTGGIWDWFDAQLIVKAVEKLGDSRIKLVFLGTKHPNSKVFAEEMDEATATRRLATQLGLEGKSVFFLDGWVPYEERAEYFLDADAAIYADKDSLETRFSHRSRVLDHFWTQLPTVCSRGDYLSELIEQKQLGLVVDRSVDAFAQAISKLKSDPKLYASIKSNLKKEAPSFTWETTLSPLVETIKTMDLETLSEQIKQQHKDNPASKKMSLKRRVRHSARVMLKGR